MRRYRNRVARLVAEWGPYVGVLLVFACFLAFVSWDARQQEARRAVGFAEARDGDAPSQAGREGLAEEAQREMVLREIREREAEEEERLARLRIEAPPHDMERTAHVVTLLEGLDAPRSLAIAPGRSTLAFVAGEDAGVWRAKDGSLARVIGADTPISSAQGSPLASLRDVAGIAFASDQILYAVEAGEFGRLIRFHLDAEGHTARGERIDVPGLWNDFAWSALAVAPDGRLLLSATNRERGRTDQGRALHVDALLYRDGEGQWWILQERLAGPIVSVSFSKSGEQAVFVCRSSGEVAWVDLRTTRPTGGTSSWRARAPRSVAILPNGALLVAEGGGSLWSVDPGTDRSHVLADALPALSEAVWDRAARRILAVDREAGRISSVSLDPGFDTAEDRMVFARYEPLFHLVHVPERPPAYLAEVLNLGGYRSTPARPLMMTFRDFAQRVPLVSAEMLAEPEHEVHDPIRYLQFVVFETDLLPSVSQQPSTVLAAFYARTASGGIIRTSALSLSEANLLLPADLATAPAPAEIVVPNAASLRLSAGGISTIDFLGYGSTPDFSITIDPLHDGGSLMQVRNLDGTQEQYRLQRPQRAPNEDQWVVAATYRLADQWKRLDEPLVAASVGAGR